MAYCERCRQALFSAAHHEASSALTLADDVSTCIEYATSTARAKGAAEVGLVHLLHAIAVRVGRAASSEAGKTAWTAYREQLEDRMIAEMLSGRHADHPPVLSGAVETILSRSFEAARRQGRRLAELADVLDTARATGNAEITANLPRVDLPTVVQNVVSEPTGAGYVQRGLGPSLLPDRDAASGLARMGFVVRAADEPGSTDHAFAPWQGPDDGQPVSTRRVPVMRPVMDYEPRRSTPDRQAARNGSIADTPRDGGSRTNRLAAIPGAGPSIERLLLQLVQRVEDLERKVGQQQQENRMDSTAPGSRSKAGAESNRELADLLIDLQSRIESALRLRPGETTGRGGNAGENRTASTKASRRQPRSTGLRRSSVRGQGSKLRRRWSVELRTRRGKRPRWRRGWTSWRRLLVQQGLKALRGGAGGAAEGEAVAGRRTGRSSRRRTSMRRFRWDRVASEASRPAKPARDSTRAVTAASPAPRDGDGDSDTETDGEKRFYLSLEDDVVNAPSIGPRTAERLHPAGISTVLDLLACDPEEAAGIVKVRYITAATIADWQDQARLVCTVPWLRGTHAQILVGAGYRDAEQIATADADDLLRDILRFATSKEGQRVLRNGAPPSLEKVLNWVRNAGEAELERVA